jgi:hypothetical protein
MEYIEMTTARVIKSTFVLRRPSWRLMKRRIGIAKHVEMKRPAHSDSPRQTFDR